MYLHSSAGALVEMHYSLFDIDTEEETKTILHCTPATMSERSRYIIQSPDNVADRLRDVRDANIHLATLHTSSVTLVEIARDAILHRIHSGSDIKRFFCISTLHQAL